MFNERLLEMIKKRGTNPSRLAKELGMSKSSMSGYVKGTSVPSITVVEKLSDLLDISTDYLIKGTKLDTGLSEDETNLLQTYNELNKKNKLMIKEEINHLKRIQKIENM